MTRTVPHASRRQLQRLAPCSLGCRTIRPSLRRGWRSTRLPFASSPWGFTSLPPCLLSLECFKSSSHFAGSFAAALTFHHPMNMPTKMRMLRRILTPNKVTGANSRPASQFERQGLRQRLLDCGSHGRHHRGAAVAQFCRSAQIDFSPTSNRKEPQ